MGALKPGSMIGGRYLAVMPLGDESNAAVWQAMDTETGYQVALSLYYPTESVVEANIQNFIEAIDRIRAIEHANVATMQEVGRFEDGTVYASMELLEGRSLDERLTEEPPLKLAELANIGSLALEGLAALHKVGIVHGTIKPENIFIQATLGKLSVKLIGMDRWAAASTLQQIPCSVGKALETIAYSSPEEVRGEFPLIPQSDIYSMAVVLFEAIAGRLPISGANVDELVKDIVTPEKPLLSSIRPELPDSLSNVLNKALAVDLQQRYSNAKSFQIEFIDSVKEAKSGLRKSYLPVMEKDAKSAKRVMEWESKELGIDADPEEIDKNVVIQVQSKQHTTRPAKISTTSTEQQSAPPTEEKIVAPQQPAESPDATPRVDVVPLMHQPTPQTISPEKLPEPAVSPHPPEPQPMAFQTQPEAASASPMPPEPQGSAPASMDISAQPPVGEPSHSFAEASAPPESVEAMPQDETMSALADLMPGSSPQPAPYGPAPSAAAPSGVVLTAQDSPALDDLIQATTQTANLAPPAEKPSPAPVVVAKLGSSPFELQEGDEGPVSFGEGIAPPTSREQTSPDLTPPEFNIGQESHPNQEAFKSAPLTTNDPIGVAPVLISQQTGKKRTSLWVILIIIISVLIGAIVAIAVLLVSSCSSVEPGQLVQGGTVEGCRYFVDTSNS